MTTITLSKRELLKAIGKKLTDAQLKDRISYLGTDLESIKGDKINVEIFPSRPDLLSLHGLARALASFTGVKTGLRDYKVKKSDYQVIIDKSVSGIRPFTACAVVKNLKFDNQTIKEVIDLQEKLHLSYGRNRKRCAIGIYPFEKIKLPIRYTAKDPTDILFQPLEYPRKLNGAQILSKHPTGREYGHLLEGKKRFPIFVDANEEILSMPPIINSDNVGKIARSTKEVFIEVSGFDFRIVSECINMIVCALADTGGEIYSMRLKYPGKTYTTPVLKPKTLKLNEKFVQKILGLNLSNKRIKTSLEKMGYAYQNGMVRIPSYRSDIISQIDIVEDIAIGYGYENFEEEIPKAATIGLESDISIFKNHLADILAGLGLIEVATYNLTSKENQTKMMNSEVPLVELKNSISQEFGVLRSWVIPSLLSVLKTNKHHEYPQNIFGFGTIFKKKQNIIENDRLCVMLCEPKADFTRAKQILDYIANACSFKYQLSETEHKSFISGRVGRVSVRGKNIAYIGELHPQVLSNFELEMPVSTFELNITELLETLKIFK